MTEAEADAMGNTQYVFRVSHITVPRCPYCDATTKQRCYSTVIAKAGSLFEGKPFSKLRYYECGMRCNHPASDVGGSDVVW